MKATEIAFCFVAEAFWEIKAGKTNLGECGFAGSISSKKLKRSRAIALADGFLVQFCTPKPRHVHSECQPHGILEKVRWVGNSSYARWKMCDEWVTLATLMEEFLDKTRKRACEAFCLTTKSYKLFNYEKMFQLFTSNTHMTAPALNSCRLKNALIGSF